MIWFMWMTGTVLSSKPCTFPEPPTHKPQWQTSVWEPKGISELKGAKLHLLSMGLSEKYTVTEKCQGWQKFSTCLKTYRKTAGVWNANLVLANSSYSSCHWNCWHASGHRFDLWRVSDCLQVNERFSQGKWRSQWCVLYWPSLETR